MDKVIHVKDGEVASKLAAGAEILATAVGSTMGPGGHTVIIQKSYGPPLITKDGVSVAKEVSSNDPLENMAIEIIKEAAERTADSAGDGTTTSIVLANSLFSAIQSCGNHTSLTNLFRGIEKAKDCIIDRLTAGSVSVKTKEQKMSIAKISTNGDEEMSSLVVDAVEHAREYGIIKVIETSHPTDSIAISKGMQHDVGYTNHNFINDVSAQVMKLDNVRVICFAGKLDLTDELIGSINDSTIHNICIVAEEYTKKLEVYLVNLNLSTEINIVLIEGPEFGKYRVDAMADVAAITGDVPITATVDLDGILADVIASTSRLRENFTEYNGVFKSITIHSNFSVFEPLETADTSRLIASRVETIEDIISNATSEFEIAKLETRLAKLTSGVITINVGGNSATEVKERRDRIDDAVGAVKAAMREGVIVGGGHALLDCIGDDASDEAYPDDLPTEEELGWSLMYDSIEAPFRQIANNANTTSVPVDDMIRMLLERENGDVNTNGYDFNTGEYVDLFEYGIIDPLEVTKTALTNAVSVAVVLGGTKVAITGIPTMDGTNRMVNR